MTYLSTHAIFDPAASLLPVPLDGHELLPNLELILAGLGDGRDRPELWATLADPRHRDSMTELFWLVDALHPHQADAGVRKALALIAGVIQCAFGDRDDALALLDGVVAHHPNCEQAAGAAAFARASRH